jgi:hypothetical protein
MSHLSYDVGLNRSTIEKKKDIPWWMVTTILDQLI